MKQCVYHLHIPRTSGVLIRELFKKNNPKSFVVAGHREKLFISDMMNADFISGHYGTLPIQYSSQTFAIYREPVDRTFSYLKYIWPRFYSNMNFIDFLNFFFSNKNLVESITNQQSKFLTGNINLERYNNDIYYLKKMVENNWHIENYETDIESVKDYINKSNINIFNYEEPDLYKKIINSINLNIPEHSFDDVVNSSLKIDEQTYSSYTDKIKEINNIDLELYDYFKK